MLEHTRKHPTKEMHLFKKAGMAEMRTEIETSMPFEEAISILLGGEPQGAVMLRGLRNREGITQAELGKLLGIEQTNLSKMERGKRPIGKKIAMRLAKLFQTDYRLFL